MDYHRRRCEKISFDDLIINFELGNHRILQKYMSSLNKLQECGLSHLSRLTEDYMNSREQIKPNLKKELKDEPNKSSHTRVDFNPVSQPTRQSASNKHNSQAKRRLKRISQHFAKFVEDQPQQDQAFCEDIDITNKSLNELILESATKFQKKQDSDHSVYEMTDYSSNESSNEHDYSERFKEDEKDSPLFGSFFKQSLNEAEKKFDGDQKKSLNFQPFSLISSPKKNRRLYIRDKKVPKWAQDLKEVGRQAELQRRDPRFNPLHIYGQCIVEHLDSNILFRLKENYKRSSSAKWGRTAVID